MRARELIPHRGRYFSSTPRVRGRSNLGLVVKLDIDLNCQIFAVFYLPRTFADFDGVSHQKPLEESSAEASQNRFRDLGIVSVIRALTKAEITSLQRSDKFRFLQSFRAEESLYQ